jgi:TRAP-type C4-dicarboxylate transport system permease small subunit
VSRLGNGLELFLKLICALLCAGLTIDVFLQVFYRFILKAPLVWTEELALFLFQWMVFMGAGLAVRHRSHFGLDVVVHRLPEGLRKFLDKFSQVIIFLIALTMIYYGWVNTEMTMIQIYATLNFPVGYCYASIPVSGAFAAVFAIINEYEDWKKKREEA